MFKPNVEKHDEVMKLTYEDLKAKLEEFGKCAIVRPTGMGKTYLSVQVLTESEDIIDYLMLEPTNLIISNIQHDYPLVNSNNLVTYATLYSHMKSVDFDKNQIPTNYLNLQYIVIDEVHRAGAEKQQKAIELLIEANPQAKLIGLTATEYRTDSRSMVEEIFDNIKVFRYDIQDAINDKIFPCPEYKVLDIDENFKMNVVEHLKDSMSKAERNVQDTIKFIVFHKNSAYIDQFKEMILLWFNELYPEKRIVEYEITSQNSKMQNDKYLLEFCEGSDPDTIYLCHSINIMNEGVHNIKKLTGALMLRKTNSRIVFQQQFGRCFEYGMSEVPVILDFVGNIDKMYYFNKSKFGMNPDNAGEPEDGKHFRSYKGKDPKVSETSISSNVSHSYEKDMTELLNDLEIHNNIDLLKNTVITAYVDQKREIPFLVKKYQVSYRTIYFWLLNVGLLRKGNENGKETVELILERHLNGIRAKEIAEEFESNETYIWSILSVYRNKKHARRRYAFR